MKKNTSLTDFIKFLMKNIRFGYFGQQFCFTDHFLVSRDGRREMTDFVLRRKKGGKRIYEEVMIHFGSWKPSFEKIVVNGITTRVLKGDNSGVRNNSGYSLKISGWENGMVLIEKMRRMKSLSFTYESPVIHAIPTH